MKKKFTQGLILLLLLPMMLLSSMPFATQAEGESDFNVEQLKLYYTPSGGTLTEYSGQDINQWVSLKVVLEFALEDYMFGSDPGYTPDVVIQLPDELEFTDHHRPENPATIAFPIEDDDGNLIANAAIDVAAKTITLTFTDYPQTKADVIGELSFWVRVDENEDQVSETKHYVIEIGGEPYDFPPLEYVYVGENPEEKMNKWGTVVFHEDPENPENSYFTIVYGMRVNMGSADGNPPYGTVFSGEGIITDDLGFVGMGHIMPESLVIRFTGDATPENHWASSDPSLWRYYRWTDFGNYEDMAEELLNEEGIVFTLTDDAVTPVNFRLEIPEMEGTQIFIGYTVRLDSDPVANEEFSNRLSVTCNGDTVKYTQRTKYLVGGEGSGSGRDFGVSISKTNSADNQPLAGATFSLYNVDASGGRTNFIKNATDNGDGTYSFTGLLRKKYIIVETAAPSGYILDDTTEYVADLTALSGDERIYTLPTITNDPLPPKLGILITKNSSVPGTAALPGAIFALYATDANGEKVEPAITTSTDNGDGTYSFSGLDAGKYIIIETTSPSGYILDDTTEYLADLTALASGTTIYATTIENNPTLPKLGIVITKNSREDDAARLPGAIFTLYAADANGEKVEPAIATSTDNGDGTYSFAGLDAGKYIIKETAAPSGYILDNTTEYLADLTALAPGTMIYTVTISNTPSPSTSSESTSSGTSSGQSSSGQTSSGLTSSEPTSSGLTSSGLTSSGLASSGLTSSNSTSGTDWGTNNSTINDNNLKGDSGTIPNTGIPFQLFALLFALVFSGILGIVIFRRQSRRAK